MPQLQPNRSRGRCSSPQTRPRTRQFEEIHRATSGDALAGSAAVGPCVERVVCMDVAANTHIEGLELGKYFLNLNMNTVYNPNMDIDNNRYPQGYLEAREALVAVLNASNRVTPVGDSAAPAARARHEFAAQEDLVSLHLNHKGRWSEAYSGADMDRFHGHRKARLYHYHLETCGSDGFNQGRIREILTALSQVEVPDWSGEARRMIDPVDVDAFLERVGGDALAPARTLALEPLPADIARQHEAAARSFTEAMAQPEVKARRDALHADFVALGAHSQANSAVGENLTYDDSRPHQVWCADPGTFAQT